MNALIAALMAAPSVAQYSKETSLSVPDQPEIAILREKIFAPLNRKDGYSRFGSDTKHPGSSRSGEIQYAQEQGKT